MTTVGKLLLGEAVFEIVDEGERAVFADAISEAVQLNGIVRLGLVSIVVDGDGAAAARVCSRIRMNLATATDLRNALTNLLDENAEAREKAN